MRERVNVEVLMGKARQTFERRQLGLALRRLRLQAGRSQEEAARAMGKARARVIELEDGRSASQHEDLVKLLDCYEVSAHERQTVLDLGSLARTRQKRRVHTDLLPDSFQRFADLEASASEISCYESSVIPGLLQSPGYLRAIIADADGVWWDSSEDALRERISFREDRQVKTLDTANPKVLRFVIGEGALRGAVGSPETMHEQRRHILNLLESNRNLTVRVLRSDTYGNPARGGGLTVFGFGDRGSPIGITPGFFAPAAYFDDEADTAAMLRGFERLEKLALGLKESARLIRQIDKEP
jgi:transcriptional regulator with XRE-family HTH domain